MSADINTEIVVNGTKEQLLAFYEAIRTLFYERRKRYNEKRDCFYLQSLNIGTEPDWSSKVNVALSPQEDIDKVLSQLTDTLYIDMMGPYGRFGNVDDIDLFEILAQAVPDCSFKGFVGGFDAGGDLALAGELKDGLLNLKYLYPHEDWEDEDEEDWDEEATYDPVAKKYILELSPNEASPCQGRWVLRSKTRRGSFQRRCLCCCCTIRNN